MEEIFDPLAGLAREVGRAHARVQGVRHEEQRLEQARADAFPGGLCGAALEPATAETLS